MNKAQSECGLVMQDVVQHAAEVAGLAHALDLAVSTLPDGLTEDAAFDRRKHLATVAALVALLRRESDFLRVVLAGAHRGQ